jgi:hypothetical protein
MTHHFGFVLAGQCSPKQLLQKGLIGYTVESAPGGLLDAVRLFVAGGGIVVVRSEVSSIASDSWIEVGTLVFSQSYGVEVEGAIPVVALPEEWTDIAAIEVLSIDLNDVSADCGVAITNNAGREIILAAGAFPHSVSLIAPLFNREFQGEYRFEQYKRLPLEM